MDPKHLTAVIVSAILGVILLVTVVAPIVSDGQTTTGDPITLTNNSPIVLREVEPGDVLKCTSTYDTTSHNTWTLNDEPVTTLTTSSLGWNVGVMSDGFYMQILGAENSNMAIWYDMTSTSAAINYVNSATETNTLRTYTVTFGDGTITTVFDSGSGSPSTKTYEYSWGYSICPYGEGEYCAPVSGGVGIVKDPNQVILCGAYTSGDLDTMYYYKDGQTYVSNDAYTMTANITTAVHTGTTDIYDATVSVDMTDGTDTETFTPYRILVPYEVTGHADSGSLYSMLGVIPIVVAIGIVLGVVSMAIVNRYD